MSLIIIKIQFIVSNKGKLDFFLFQKNQIIKTHFLSLNEVIRL